MLHKRREEKSRAEEKRGDERRKRGRREMGVMETQNRQSGREKEEETNEAWSRGKERRRSESGWKVSRREKTMSINTCRSPFLSQGNYSPQTASLSFSGSFCCSNKKSKERRAYKTPG